MRWETGARSMTKIESYFAGRDDVMSTLGPALTRERQRAETLRERIAQASAALDSMAREGIEGGVACERRALEGAATPSEGAHSMAWGRGYAAAFESLQRALNTLQLDTVATREAR